eukprot:613358-Alexandrium_andersonii.AAC.1
MNGIVAGFAPVIAFAHADAHVRPFVLPSVVAAPVRGSSGPGALQGDLRALAGAEVPVGTDSAA